MTSLAHRVCSFEYGCVDREHTSATCYWRYVDNMETEGKARFTLTRALWQSVIDFLNEEPA